MTPAPLRIGLVTIDFPFLLAPMAGYTDSAFRVLCRRYGAGAVFTEVVNAPGIVHESLRTLNYLAVSPGESPVAAHLYGADPGVMAEAAAIVESMKCFDFIDLNCGCPVRKIVAKGAGAALIKKPERIEAIVRAMSAAVSLPVTVKTRIGFSPDLVNMHELAHAVHDGGGKALFVHARLASKVHSGPADWDALARLKSTCAIPLVGNGGVVRAQDALDMVARTGVDGVMIGRGAVGNPWIFDEIRHLLDGHPYTPPTVEEIRSVMLEQLDRMTELMRVERRKRRCKHPLEHAAVLHFRGHLVRYLAGFNGFPDLRRKLQTLATPEALVAEVDAVLAQGRRAI